MSKEIENAIEVLKQAMIDDGPSELGSYAHSWHCNIAMACFDSIKSHEVEAYHEDDGAMSSGDALKISNDAASRFMKVLFDIETTNEPVKKIENA
jgi:hypothetical protein